MFTGIVRGIGQITRVKRLPDLMRYSVRLDAELLKGIERGASIAVDGVCQTVVGFDDSEVSFEAIPETLQRTTLAELNIGDRVNIERSARVGDEIGGHMLSGHVYGTVRLEEIDAHTHYRVLRMTCDPDWTRYLLRKGFVALHGCSLTLVDVEPAGRFTVHLIPETQRVTTLGQKQAGDHLNIEFDTLTQAVVDTVERLIKKGASHD